MADIRSGDEPVGRMAKLMAKLYYFMAEEMLDRLGEEEGKEAIRSAITKFGRSRVASMLKEAEERRLDINKETYSLVRDMPGISWEKDECNPNDITYCPMHDMWESLDANDIGQIYCEIDDIFFKSFNIDYERPLCKTKGDACCRFIYK